MSAKLHGTDPGRVAVVIARMAGEFRAAIEVYVAEHLMWNPGLEFRTAPTGETEVIIRLSDGRRHRIWIAESDLTFLVQEKDL